MSNEVLDMDVEDVIRRLISNLDVLCEYRELQISLRKDSNVEVISAKEEEEEREKIVEEECYEVHEEYKEASWRGKS
jgi:hypothetical protein